jgi:hypothetical protein
MSEPVAPVFIDGRLDRTPGLLSAGGVEAAHFLAVFLPALLIGHKHAEAGVRGNRQRLRAGPRHAHPVNQILRVARSRTNRGLGDLIELPLIGEPLLRERQLQNFERFGEAVAGFVHGDAVGVEFALGGAAAINEAGGNQQVEDSRLAISAGPRVSGAGPLKITTAATASKQTSAKINGAGLTRISLVIACI